MTQSRQHCTTSDWLTLASQCHGRTSRTITSRWIKLDFSWVALSLQAIMAWITLHRAAGTTSFHYATSSFIWLIAISLSLKKREARGQVSNKIFFVKSLRSKINWLLNNYVLIGQNSSYLSSSRWCFWNSRRHQITKSCVLLWSQLFLIRTRCQVRSMTGTIIKMMLLDLGSLTEVMTKVGCKKLRSSNKSQ